MRAIFTAARYWLVFLIFIPPIAHAEVLDDWLEEAQSRNLAANPEWLALLHYEAQWGKNRYRSYVNDANFFLAEDGATNPAHELEATVKAFFEQPDTQCRFVARRQWLELALSSTGALPDRVDCVEYRQWRDFLGTRQVVLVFASSYLNSPSSMYGHTFLRFDSSNIKMDTPLLSYALNFGAHIPPDENGLIYAYRGLAGGYPGEFTATPYFETIRNYSRMENRDLWEYRLNLDAGEIDFMLAHIWELHEINFYYYFFDENCSLRLLELLDVARPGANLAKQFEYSAIPIDTVRSVVDAGMIVDTVYRPANLTRLEYQIAQLSKKQQQLARELADDIDVIDEPEFTALQRAKQIQVAQTAYDYLRYTVNSAARDPLVARRSHALLAYINKNIGSAPIADNLPVPTRPDLGHDTMLLSIGAGVEDHDAFADFEWRISYHDLLDASAGYPQGASLNMGRFVIRARENDSIRLQRFDVVEITSLSSRTDFFKPLSWRVDTGLEREWTKGDDTLVGQANGGGGLVWSPFEDSQLFGLLTGRVEYNPDLDRELDIAIGLSAGFQIHTDWGNTLIEANFYQFTDDVNRTRLGIAHNLPLGRNNALRFGWNRKINHSNDVTDALNEVSLAYRHYF